MLSPAPGSIPRDGSAIQVYVDGQPFGPPVSYGHFRPDIASLFPQYENSAGAIGVQTWNTLTLSDGVHTVAWGVANDRGAAAGIGSRFFKVDNTTPGVSSSSTALVMEAPADAPPVPSARTIGIPIGAVRSAEPLDERDGRGGDLGDSTKRDTFFIDQLGRLAVELGGNGACASEYGAYLAAGEELRPAPFGLSIDAAAQRLYWQPGVGYLGRYDIVVFANGCGADRQQFHLTVYVTPTLAQH